MTKSYYDYYYEYEYDMSAYPSYYSYYGYFGDYSFDDYYFYDDYYEEFYNDNYESSGEDNDGPGSGGSSEISGEGDSDEYFYGTSYTLTTGFYGDNTDLSDGPSNSTTMASVENSNKQGDKTTDSNSGKTSKKGYVWPVQTYQPIYLVK